MGGVIRRAIPVQRVLTAPEKIVVGALVLPRNVIGVTEGPPADGAKPTVLLELANGRTWHVLGSVQDWADTLKWTGGPAVRLARG